MAQSTENGQLSSLHLVSSQTLANINGGDKKKTLRDLFLSPWAWWLWLSKLGYPLLIKTKKKKMNIVG